LIQKKSVTSLVKAEFRYRNDTSRPW